MTPNEGIVLEINTNYQKIKNYLNKQRENKGIRYIDIAEKLNCSRIEIAMYLNKNELTYVTEKFLSVYGSNIGIEKIN